MSICVLGYIGSISKAVGETPQPHHAMQVSSKDSCTRNVLARSVAKNFFDGDSEQHGEPQKKNGKHEPAARTALESMAKKSTTWERSTETEREEDDGKAKEENVRASAVAAVRNRERGTELQTSMSANCPRPATLRQLRVSTLAVTAATIAAAAQRTQCPSFAADHRRKVIAASMHSNSKSSPEEAIATYRKAEAVLLQQHGFRQASPPTQNCPQRLRSCICIQA